MTGQLNDNPECQQGKHLNCDGFTWDELSDVLADCPCLCHSHDRRTIPREATP